MEGQFWDGFNQLLHRFNCVLIIFSPFSVYRINNAYSFSKSSWANVFEFFSSSFHVSLLWHSQVLTVCMHHIDHVWVYTHIKKCLFCVHTLCALLYTIRASNATPRCYSYMVNDTNNPSHTTIISKECNYALNVVIISNFINGLLCWVYNSATTGSEMKLCYNIVSVRLVIFQ